MTVVRHELESKDTSSSTSDGGIASFIASGIALQESQYVSVPTL